MAKVAALPCTLPLRFWREELLAQQREMALTASEACELDVYGEVDDYLSLINRLVQNLMLDSRQSRVDDLVG